MRDEREESKGESEERTDEENRKLDS